jgi:hypothetical protein
MSDLSFLLSHQDCGQICHPTDRTLIHEMFSLGFNVGETACKETGFSNESLSLIMLLCYTTSQDIMRVIIYDSIPLCEVLSENGDHNMSCTENNFPFSCASYHIGLNRL